MITTMRLFHHTAVLAVVVAFLGGCAYTLPNGDKVPREVYRAEHSRDMMTLAVAADREYDARNPVQPPPSVCVNPDQTTMTGIDLAFCAMSMATYNAQLAVREMQRKAASEYAAIVLDRQADERMAKWNLAINNPITAALANRLINGRTQASTGTRVSIRGHTVKGGVRGGSAGRGGEGTGGAEIAGAGGHGGSGGGSAGHTVGDQTINVVVGDGNQSSAGSGTHSPILEWATDMGTTRPIFDNGSTDARTLNDNDTLGLGELF